MRPLPQNTTTGKPFEVKARYTIVGENRGQGVLAGEGGEGLTKDLVSIHLHTCVGRLVANELTRRLNVTLMLGRL